MSGCVVMFDNTGVSRTATADRTNLPGEKKQNSATESAFLFSCLEKTRNRRGDKKVTCGLSSSCVKEKHHIQPHPCIKKSVFCLFSFGKFVCVRACVCLCVFSKQPHVNSEPGQKNTTRWPIESS